MPEVLPFLSDEIFIEAILASSSYDLIINVGDVHTVSNIILEIIL